MFKSSKNLIENMKNEEWARTLPVNDGFWAKMTAWLSDRLLPEFLSRISGQINEIIQIDAGLPEKKILELVAMHMVDSLDAIFASVRIYDPDTEYLLSYGSYPSEEAAREVYIPLEGSIAGKVVKSGKPYLVPSIQNEERYLDKSIIQRKGANSLMVIPFEIARFFPHERNTAGVIQIYYPENDRSFNPIEVQVAELMSYRLSFVIARKKILSMHRVNEKKEAIVRQTFLRPGSLEGVKMKDIFNRVIPELADIINIQSCALFSVSDNLDEVILEAGYPDSQHGIGKSFPVSDEPAFELVLGLRDYTEVSPYEMVTPSYVLIIDPGRSKIVSDSIKQFARNRNINSILYVPLNVGEEVTHFMTFDALDYRMGYTPEEIEIFLFLGRELMKAQRMERLDDILHDFKNPAIATAGFARRLKHILGDMGLLEKDAKIGRYVNILLEETSRLQEMAMSMSHVGREEVVNLNEVIQRRFEINEEAIKEQLKQNVTLEHGSFEARLYIKCYPLHIERVIDNILNNATNAIPLQGGILSVRTYVEGPWACAEVTNTGAISEKERMKLLGGEVRGRGFYITLRIIRLMKGKLDITAGEGTTTVTLRLPVYKEESE